MKYKVGDKIITKKTHACGNDEWTVERTGADIKIKCSKCGKTMFVLSDGLDKMCKKHIDGEVDAR